MTSEADQYCDFELAYSHILQPGGRPFAKQFITSPSDIKVGSFDTDRTPLKTTGPVSKKLWYDEGETHQIPEWILREQDRLLEQSNWRPPSRTRTQDTAHHRSHPVNLDYQILNKRKEHAARICLGAKGEFSVQVSTNSLEAQKSYKC